MTVKQKLDRLVLLRRVVSGLEERQARMDSSATGSRSEGREGSRGTAEQDRMAASIAGCIQNSDRLSEYRPEYMQLDEWARAAIAQLDVRERIAMELRYLDGKELQDVAEILHYSYGHVRNIINVGVASIEHNERQTA